MTWLDMSEQRDAAGNLTDLALALDALSDIGCDCGTDEDESCVGCLCETALKGIWEQLESAEAEVERLKAHTWEQERAVILQFAMARLSCVNIGDLQFFRKLINEILYSIEKGEHWPTEDSLASNNQGEK